nr:MAG TPA: hypothetical protein [Caudoviricetes sp.]
MHGLAGGLLYRQAYLLTFHLCGQLPYQRSVMVYHIERIHSIPGDLADCPLPIRVLLAASPLCDSYR